MIRVLYAVCTTVTCPRVGVSGKDEGRALVAAILVVVPPWVRLLFVFLFFLRVILCRSLALAAILTECIRLSGRLLPFRGPAPLIRLLHLRYGLRLIGLLVLELAATLIGRRRFGLGALWAGRQVSLRGPTADLRGRAAGTHDSWSIEGRRSGRCGNGGMPAIDRAKSAGFRAACCECCCIGVAATCCSRTN